MERQDIERAVAEAAAIWRELDATIKAVDRETARVRADGRLSDLERKEELAKIRDLATTKANKLVTEELRMRLEAAIHTAERQTPAGIARRFLFEPQRHLALMHELERDSAVDLAERFGDAEVAGDAAALRTQHEVLRELGRRSRELPDEADRQAAREQRGLLERRFHQRLSPELTKWAATHKDAREALGRIDGGYMTLTRPGFGATDRLKIARGEEPFVRVEAGAADAPTAREQLHAERTAPPAGGE